MPGFSTENSSTPRSFMPRLSIRASAVAVGSAVNAASGNRPLVVLANLSGFDGSPEIVLDLIGLENSPVSLRVRHIGTTHQNTEAVDSRLALLGKKRNIELDETIE